ncbi:hypothetical protein CTAYLR_002589 [Chrysophaeum taylorii]|uniref:G8 domain-containing protein n=1 Tax=Chrysophaeum taylorii TaxID=2483200 RepID=A0AAD7UD22_9STRA|nr:hypothetical protein CTAYLR_002589 [Chrysophaeum taylorii]
MFFAFSVVVAVVASACSPASPAAAPDVIFKEQQVVIDDDVLTRNSEVVDLGHPGPFGGIQQHDCPQDEDDFDDDDDAFGDGYDVTIDGKVLLTKCAVEGKVFGTITVNGELAFADQDINLHAHEIRVNGKLRAGSETCRLRSRISITLHGERSSFKGIEVAGELDVHATEYYHAWSRLARTAEPGDEMLILQDPVNWEENMTIVVTTTHLRDSRDWHQNEILRVTSVSASAAGATAVGVTPPVTFKHYGGSEYQAEVGLLTRRFKIQGDASSSEPTDVSPLACAHDKYASVPCDNHHTGYGGHLIILGEARISGVEFYRMGQTNQLGRYPVHWHLAAANTANRNFIQDSSFHRSFYRCVTIHGTNGVRVSRNVAFDVIGHCVYLEDGVEENNVIEYNLVAHVHPIGIPPGDGSTKQFLDDIPASETLENPADSTASGFYISNAMNAFKGNAAVGGYAGYQIPLLPTPTGIHASSDVDPRRKFFLEFDGNSCRSTGYWWSHAGCLYVGGLLRDNAYNPGRSTRYDSEPCQVDQGNSCPRAPENYEGCTGEYPWGCWAALEVTNFKASLCSVGVMSWGDRIRIKGFEAHDIVGGPIAELFGDNSVDNFVVTCRTDNFPTQPACGGAADAHYGDQSVWNCKGFDRRAWRWETKVVAWYDTAMLTLFTDATIRKCDPSQWTGCAGDCLDKSTIFRCLTHSDRWLPEWMGLTGGWRFEEDPSENIRNYVVEFSNRKRWAAAQRNAAWLDADGAVCDLSSSGSSGGGGGAVIVGSNYGAGNWWYLDDTCVAVGRDDLMWCCRAYDRWLVSTYLKWDDALLAELDGTDTGTYCDNDDGAPCPTHGYLAKFGDLDLVNDGTPIAQRAELVGAAPGPNSTPLGHGWYFWFDKAPPAELRLTKIQAHHDSVWVVASTYPKGTTFTVQLTADGDCDADEYLCAVAYERVDALEKLVPALPQYYVDDDTDDSATTIFVRVVQRPDRRLSETKEWLQDQKLPVYTNDYLKSLDDRPDWGINDHTFADPELKITAHCAARDGAYCAGGPVPKRVPPLMWHHCKRAIVDGHANNDGTTTCPDAAFSDDQDMLYVDPYQELAGVRCCNGLDDDDGSSECDYGCERVAFKEAQARCAAKEGAGWRLCTPDEISSGKAKSTGCGYDFMHVWTSGSENDCATEEEEEEEEEEEDKCSAIVDAVASNENESKCPNAAFSDVADPNLLYVQPTRAVAGVRCCDGVAGASECQFSCEEVTFAEAEARCAAKEGGNWRLCTVDELLVDEVGIGTGCLYDFMHVWTSESTACAQTSSCPAIADAVGSNENESKCPNAAFSDETDPDLLYAQPTQAVAGVRCCNGVAGSSECQFNCEEVTFAEAEARCAAKEGGNWRLCTVDELLVDEVGTGTGCFYDFMHVWTSGSGDCPSAD